MGEKNLDEYARNAKLPNDESDRLQKSLLELTGTVGVVRDWLRDTHNEKERTLQWIILFDQVDLGFLIGFQLVNLINLIMVMKYA